MTETELSHCLEVRFGAQLATSVVTGIPFEYDGLHMLSSASLVDKGLLAY